MQTLNTRFEHILGDLIRAQVDELSMQIAAGQAPTFEEYRFLAGRVAGLRMAIDHFDEVNRLLNER